MIVECEEISEIPAVIQLKSVAAEAAMVVVEVVLSVSVVVLQLKVREE